MLDDGLHIIELYGLMDGKELLTKRCYLQMDQNSMSPPVLRDTEIERERVKCCNSRSTVWEV